MVETHPEKRLIGYARVSTYGQTTLCGHSARHMEPRRWQHPDLPEWGLCVPRVHGGVVERMLCKGPDHR